MPKKVIMEVYFRSEGLCELTGSNYRCEQHHIVFRRHNNHDPEAVINLGWHKHKGNEGVHGKNGHALDLDLKRGLQMYYERKGLSEDEIYIKMGNKFYDTDKPINGDVERHFEKIWQLYHEKEYVYLN
ncbi:hypothetical protein [Halocella sp. SP3-1]|uniref:hypothetical protein n=1 Tax=Halocella sp. SP3-1 TaxID=2382161 RepID=UPI000F7F7A5C|nr:hypothetical protein [Halocella sp. SP3-1]